MRGHLSLIFGAMACLGCADPYVPLPADATALDRLVVEQLESDATPGLQATVFADGEVTFSAAWGWADTETERLADPDTLFTMASVSKLVVAVAVMQIVERGAVRLDDAIDAHLPFAVRHPQHPDTPITVRMLLSHSGGIRDNWDVMNPLYTEGDSPLALGTFVAGYVEADGAYFDAARNFTPTAPGEGYEYSNLGNALTAHLVEVVDGRDFEVYCQAEIFEPLGMNRTSFRLAGLDPEALAVPTQWDRGWWPLPHAGWPDYPDGSLRTTTDQLARFMMATTGDGSHDGARVLRADSVAEMLRVQAPTLEPTQGLAYYWWDLDGERVVGHDGGDDGIASEVLYRPAHDDGVLLVANGELGVDAFQTIQRELLRR
ncbi:MAG: serine hydrolase domain-containing protein [Myxococcota bacterium]